MEAFPIKIQTIDQYSRFANGSLESGKFSAKLLFIPLSIRQSIFLSQVSGWLAGVHHHRLNHVLCFYQICQTGS
jgi:hypothetical protein